MIRSGKIKLDINPEKQNRHSLNHSLYLKNKNFALKIMKDYQVILRYLSMN